MNYVETLTKIMQRRVYRGCIIEKIRGGYFALGQKYLTEQDAERAIDNAFKKIKVQDPTR